MNGPRFSSLLSAPLLFSPGGTGIASCLLRFVEEMFGKYISEPGGLVCAWSFRP